MIAELTEEVQIAEVSIDVEPNNAFAQDMAEMYDRDWDEAIAMEMDRVWDEAHRDHANYLAWYTSKNYAYATRDYEIGRQLTRIACVKAGWAENRFDDILLDLPTIRKSKKKAA